MLFYVASPYVGTTAYPQNKIPWDINKMEKLIFELFDSKQKFIFSMRACKDVKNAKSEKTKKEIIEINREILVVFRYFNCKEREMEQKLYVLTTNFDMDELENRIRTHKQCEIMITNYRIQSFYEIGNGITPKFVNNEQYKVLEFDNFFKIAERALESF